MSEEQGVANQEDFATLLAREKTGPALQSGQVVKGRVLQISADSVFVDVQGKGEALINRAELENDDGTLQVAIGDEIEATVLSTDGEIRLSRKLLKEAQARAMLEMAVDNSLPVEGRVAGVIKGGYEVTVAGLACLLSVFSN